MKLTKLEVKSLHAIYSYTVDINEDVTFLHGINGCGKTTLLDLVTFIITGNIYKLFKYDFTVIDLSYVSDGDDSKKASKIIIHKHNLKNLEVIFCGEKRSIERMEYKEMVLFQRDARRGTQNETKNLYFERFPWLAEIRDLFNFIYLPLSRTNHENIPSETLIGPVRNSPDNSLQLVKKMIKNSCFKIASEINTINEKFRNDMFKSSFHFNKEDVLITMPKSNFLDDKVKLKQTFQDLKILDSPFERQIDDFYEKLSKSMLALGVVKGKTKTKNIDKALDLALTFVANSSRVQQLYELSELADELNLEKQKIMLPIVKYLELINDYFRESNKQVNIDHNTGDISFQVDGCDKPLGINNLSSGEKHILIFFAYLSFELNDKEGIFIIDEPELSLHLSWQRKFVKSILETNNRVQLIFATHSPEIVSQYRQKVEEVIPKLDRCSFKGDE